MTVGRSLQGRGSSLRVSLAKRSQGRARVVDVAEVPRRKKLRVPVDGNRLECQEAMMSGEMIFRKVRIPTTKKLSPGARTDSAKLRKRTLSKNKRARNSARERRNLWMLASSSSTARIFVPTVNI